jgi:glycosyltransferase involved in cell wall biosynthesis
MRVVMVSTDRKMFDRHSDVAARTAALGGVLTNLHIIVFTKRSEHFSIVPLAPHITVYPTNSISRFLYVRDAVPIGRLAANADLVTAQDPFETGLAAMQIAEKLKAPLQLQIHTDFGSPAFRSEGILNKIRLRIARRTIPRAACIRAVSSRVAHSVDAFAPGSTATSTVIPVFTNLSNYVASHEATLRAAYPQFDFIVAMVARISPEKNIGLGLEAVADLVREHPGLGLFIVGDGPERKSLEHRAHSLGIGKNVVFMGWLNNPGQIVRAADVFLFTSQYEGYGLALVEAAAAGLPIVTTDVGLVGDVLKNDQQCLVCPPNDRACLTAHLRRYLLDPALREAHGKAASAAVAPLVEKTVNEYAKEIKESYTTCIAGAKPAGLGNPSV